MRKKEGKGLSHRHLLLVAAISSLSTITVVCLCHHHHWLHLICPSAIYEGSIVGTKLDQVGRKKEGNGVWIIRTRKSGARLVLLQKHEFRSVAHVHRSSGCQTANREERAMARSGGRLPRTQVHFHGCPQDLRLPHADSRFAE